MEDLVPNARSTAYCQATTYALYTNTEFCDVRIMCTDNQDLPAHRFILARRSRYFRQKLYGKGDSVEENAKVNKHYEFPQPVSVLRCILEYLYTGSVLALEDSTSFESQAGLSLWGRLLQVSTKYSMGGLDGYLSSLLASFPVDSFAIGAERFSFALELKLQNVMAAMAIALSSLPFDEDAFENLSEEALVAVLAEVPLCESETVVCQAVGRWIEGNLFVDVDDGVAPSNITDLLSLKHISLDDLETVVEEMGIFSMDALMEAYREHALYLPQKYESRPNEKRGANKDWAALLVAGDGDSTPDDFAAPGAQGTSFQMIEEGGESEMGCDSRLSGTSTKSST